MTDVLKLIQCMHLLVSRHQVIEIHARSKANMPVMRTIIERIQYELLRGGKKDLVSSFISSIIWDSACRPSIWKSDFCSFFFSTTERIARRAVRVAFASMDGDSQGREEEEHARM